MNLDVSPFAAGLHIIIIFKANGRYDSCAISLPKHVI